MEVEDWPKGNFKHNINKTFAWCHVALWWSPPEQVPLSAS